MIAIQDGHGAFLEMFQWKNPPSDISHAVFTLINVQCFIILDL